MSNTASAWAAAPSGESVRLYLSGGSNRAALASVGAITYLATANQSVVTPYRWREVDEVIGLSGGSQPIAALISGLSRPGSADDDQRTVESMRLFYNAMAYEVRHTKASYRWRWLVLLVLVIALPIALALAFLQLDSNGGWLVPKPTLPWYLIGLAVVPLILQLARAIIRRYLRAFIADLVKPCRGGGPKLSLHETSVHAKAMVRPAGHSHGARAYFIVVHGMATSRSYAYSATQGFAPTPQPDYDASIVDACTASCALPPLSKRAWVPPRSSGGVVMKSDRRKEALLDGGFGGTFGVQIVNRVVEEFADHAKGTALPGQIHPNHRRIVAIDAGTKIREDATGRMWILRGLSTVVRLLRVLQVSGDATYRNDLEDLDQANGAVITVSRAEELKIGSKDVHELQKWAVAYNGHLKLTKVTAKQAALAAAIGVVGTYMADMAHRNLPADMKMINSHLNHIGGLLDPQQPSLLRQMWHNPAQAHPKVVL